MKYEPDSLFGRSFFDKVTGFRGVCTAYVVYETGLTELLLESVSTTNDIKKEWIGVKRLTPFNPNVDGSVNTEDTRL